MTKGYHYKETLLSWDLTSVTLLAYQAWRELDHETAYKPDWDLYVKLEKAGSLKTYLAYYKDNYNPVGVMVALISPSLHTKGERIASSDVVYILPEHRGIGAEMIKWVEEDLQIDGIDHFVLNLHPDFDKKGTLASKLEMVRGDNVYHKRLN